MVFNHKKDRDICIASLTITYQVRYIDVPFKFSNPGTATKPTPHTQQKTKKY